MERYLQELRLCAFIFITFWALLHLVEAQDQTGFISLDCGYSIHELPYDDPTTKITYSSDELLLRSGGAGRIQKEFDSTVSKPKLWLRYFPDGVRNCYTLNVTLDIKYLIKAEFVYGNYDHLDNPPSFDLHLGPNFWENIDMKEHTDGYAVEVIYKTECTYLQVCLVNTGTGIPMINTLELRPLKNDTYNTQSGSLRPAFRYYFSNSKNIIRYPDDVNDRQWTPFFDANKWTEITTNLNINTTSSYEPPQAIMASASSPISTSSPWTFNWSSSSSTTPFYIYMHFAEIQTLKSNDSREFNVTLDGDVGFESYSPTMLSTDTKAYPAPKTCKERNCLLELTKTLKSTLPPLMNAIEVFTVIDFMQMETHHQDFAAIKSIRDSYEVSKISWQGDPCVPEKYMWDGLNCINSNITTPPIIISLDLSSSKLMGIISPDFHNLTHLQELDLSNNNLTGGIPEFFADIKDLMVINLSGNNLNGSVPQSLLQKKGLKLTIEGNLDLKCSGGLCVNKSGNDGNKKMNILVPIAASIAFVVVLGVALAIFFVLKRRKRSNRKGSLSDTQVSHDKTPRSSKEAIMTKNRRFSYSEVVKMTNNFTRILGKGGFGMVYHGIVNDTEQVAVKMLSPSSSQGYKEFKAEVELLLRVHHKNLVDLVGYCDEGDKLALIYEYMANGDVKEHMSGKRRGSILNWETRLKIVVESAQGLEYLHNGCKPPMVHRDVKTTNILLNEHFQAKLADFGLSRSFIEGETHVSTIVAGTPGYLDPEYYRTNWLNEKSDVYSFGVVLLEMITNQPVINQSREKAHIAEWVGVMLAKGDIQNIMDPKLYGDYDSSSVWRAVELAMSCLNPSSARRPTMAHVIVELNECLAYESSKGGTSHNMDSQSSAELSMNFRLDVESTPAAR